MALPLRFNSSNKSREGESPLTANPPIAAPPPLVAEVDGGVAVVVVVVDSGDVNDGVAVNGVDDDDVSAVLAVVCVCCG